LETVITALGAARILLTTCEEQAIAGGFRRLEMGSTLGVALYRASGYVEPERLDLALENGDATYR
jgi:hypothetical protein